MDAWEPRLSLVTLAVADLAASAGFYERLGFQAGFRNDEVAFFQLNGVVLGLWDRAHMAKHLRMDAAQLGPGGIELAHNVRRREDVDAALAAAVEAGGRLLREPADQGWGGRSGHVADPDGHRWEVAWNPDWTVTEGGQTLLAPAPDPHR